MALRLSGLRDRAGLIQVRRLFGLGAAFLPDGAALIRPTWSCRFGMAQ